MNHSAFALVPALLLIGLAPPLPGATIEKTRLTYHVQDENGNPIPGAMVEPVTDFTEDGTAGWTDSDGDCEIRVRVMSGSYRCCISAPGYLPVPYADIQKGYWRTNSVLTVTLHPLAAPEGYRHSRHEASSKLSPRPGDDFWRTPELDRPYGYDLYEDDWVEPVGRGTNADVYVTQHYARQGKGHCDYRRDLEFPNPGDGMVLVPFGDPPLRLTLAPMVAPAGGYTNRYTIREKHVNGRYARVEYPPVVITEDDLSAIDRSRLYFRFRTAESGGVTNAYHGVFAGELDRRPPRLFRAVCEASPGSYTTYATNRLVLFAPSGDGSSDWCYHFNTNRCSRVLTLEKAYRAHQKLVAEYYTPPPGAKPPVPGSEAFAAREVAYDSNSLGMRISREEAGGVRFGLHEVRNRDFRAFRKGHDSAMGTRLKLTDRNQPVVGVSYEDAAAFCAWLTERERSRGSLDSGHLYRLPTCDEWFAAAGVGVVGIETNAYPWGWDWPPPRKPANLFNEGSASKDGFADGIEDYDDGSLLTASVGSYPPNRRGLYDIAGNVWEMSATEADGETDVALHGGSWRTADPESLHIDSMEVYGGPANDVGFRVVVAPVSSPLAPVPPSPPAGGEEPSVAPIPEAVGTNVLASLGMVPVPAGTLRRFSTIGRPDPDDAYAEIHDAVNLRVTTNFWIAAREVTQAQYEAVMGTNRSSSAGASLPVDNVTWDEAMDFCARLTAFARSRNAIPAGYAYSLPTETQWEFACVAGSTNRWGFSVFDEAGLSTNAWHGANSGGALHPVGTKAPNALGLFDMLGNVLELCSDWHDESFPTASEDDPQGPPNGDGKVMRGGCVLNAAGDCGPEVRLQIPPDVRSPYVGFRVALVPEEP